MWKVVSRAAISVSAALDELWFLGDLLGIFWSSMLPVFFFVFFALVVGWGVLVDVFGLLALGVLEGRRYCG